MYNDSLLYDHVYIAIRLNFNHERPRLMEGRLCPMNLLVNKKNMQKKNSNERQIVKVKSARLSRTRNAIELLTVDV